MSETNRLTPYLSVLRRCPDAHAVLNGSPKCPALHGTVRFYQTPRGVLVAAEVTGLPRPQNRCGCSVHGFHIHSGQSCTGNAADPFADAQGHYNPCGCPHPAHAGDMPPLFASDGCAFQVFLTNRFTVREILNRTVILHSGADDFTTQPAGNSGAKIACGCIRPH